MKSGFTAERFGFFLFVPAGRPAEVTQVQINRRVISRALVSTSLETKQCEATEMADTH